MDADRDMPNLDIAAGALDDPRVEVLANRDGRPVADLLPAAPGRPVLVDCPAGGGPDAVDPLRHASRALVVTTASREAVEDALKTAAMVRSVGTPVAGVVVNRRREPPEGLRDASDAPVVACVPTVDRPLADPDAAAAYDELAGRLAAME